MDDGLGQKAAEGGGLSAEDVPAAVPRALRGSAPPGYLGHRARLRRRLVDGGPAALLDHELLEIVLFLALPRRDTKPIAQALMRRFGGLAGAVSAPTRELDAVGGLTEAGVAALKAVEAAALRCSRAAVAEQRPVLDSGERLVGYLAAAALAGGGGEWAARLRVLFLDACGRLIVDEAQAHVAAGHAAVFSREIVRRALEVGAAALVLVRDHPGGDAAAAPSRVDLVLAAEVKAAAAVFGIGFHDHLIVGRGGRASLRGEGLP